jgi:hypothetical protein
MGLSPLQHKLQDDDVLIHLHIPKTGGSSLNYLLEQKFPAEAMFYVPTAILSRHELMEMNLDSYRMIIGHIKSSIAQYISKTPLFIAMLRHPVERIISFYYFVRSRPQILSYDVANQLSFEEFIESEKFHVREHIHNQMVRILSGQDDYSQIPTHTELELAKKQLEDMPFIGLTEYFEESVQLLFYTFIWQDSFEVPYRNVTDVRPTRAEVSPAITQKILDHNQLDLELYLFAKQLFHQRYRQMVDELSQNNLSLHKTNQDLKLDNQRLYSQLHNPKFRVIFYRTLFPQKSRLLLRELRRKWFAQPKD